MESIFCHLSILGKKALKIGNAMLILFAATCLTHAGIVPMDQLVAGKSYGEWAAEFWEWVLPIPYDGGHPFKDWTGTNVLRGQGGPVLHLYGASNPTYRSITIPDDRFLYIAILNLSCTSLDKPPYQPATTNEVDMRSCAESFHEADLDLDIEGVAVPNLEQYHVSSPVFGFVVPANNIFGVPSGTVGLGIGAAEGVILEPLPPGSHRIYFHGRYPALGYTADVVYQITVYARPVLSVRQFPDQGVIQLSWPWSPTADTFTLQESDRPALETSWCNAPVLSRSIQDDTVVATVRSQPTHRFFRLYRPLWQPD